MNNSIKLGKLEVEDGGYGSQDLEIDLDILLSTRSMIAANSGGGKSWLIRLICERAAAHLPIILFDTEGEFASLREKIDAILVGPEGDVSNDPRSAKLLARKLVELRTSAIIDLYEFPGTSADTVLNRRREYVRSFIDALLLLPKTLRTPYLIVIDEMHLFCPEQGKGSSVALQSIIDLASLGRKRGLALIGASQRFSKVNNDALAELKNVFIGQTTLTNDQKRAADTLGKTLKEVNHLKEFEPGEFYCFGPAFLTKGLNRFRTDNVETSHPKAGEIRHAKPPEASSAIKQIVEHLSDLPQQAEEEARDVASLEKKVRKLEIDLEESRKTSGTATEEKQLNILRANLEQRESALAEAEKALAATSEQVNSIAESAKLQLVEVENKGVELANLFAGRISIFAERFDVWKGELGDLAIAAELPKVDISERLPYSQMLNKVTAAENHPKIPMPQRTVAQNSPSIEVPKKATAIVTGEPSETRTRLNGKQQKLLDVLLAFERLGRSEVERSIVGAFIDMSSTSGSFNTYLSGLKNGREGEFPPMIDYRPGSRITLTDEGRNAAQSTIEINGLADLHEAWRNQIKIQKQRDVMDLLIGAYPSAVTRKFIGETIGMSDTSGSFNTYMSALKSYGIIEYTKVQDQETNKQVSALKATDLLFPEGLR